MAMNANEERNAGYAVHQEVWESLPWYVTGTLEQGESARVEQHAANCVACRSELSYLRRLGRLVHASEDYVPSPTRGLQAVLSRIDQEQKRPDQPWGTSWRAFWRTPLIFRGALLAQAALILVLLGVLVTGQRPQPEAPYRTLADVERTEASLHGQLRVVFDEQAKEQEIRDLLRSVDAEIIRGPSPIGAYTLKVEISKEAGTDSSAVLHELRSKAIVRFAEPIVPGGTRIEE